MPDYSIIVEPALKSKGALRNFSMSFTCDGMPYTLHGLTYIFKLPTGEEAVQWRLVAPAARGSITLLLGPNPPPPPPPTAKCAAAHDKAACDAVKPTKGSSKGCAWCTSGDKVHALCFDALHEPDASASWSCDQS